MTVQNDTRAQSVELVAHFSPQKLSRKLGPQLEPLLELLVAYGELVASGQFALRIAQGSHTVGGTNTNHPRQLVRAAELNQRIVDEATALSHKLRDDESVSFTLVKTPSR